MVFHRLKPSMRRPLPVKGYIGFSLPFHRNYPSPTDGRHRNAEPPVRAVLPYPPASFIDDQREAPPKLPLLPFPEGF